MHCRLLEIPHEAVEQLRPDDIEAGQERRQGDLASLDDGARDGSGLEEAHAHDEMHALVLRLLEQSELMQRRGRWSFRARWRARWRGETKKVRGSRGAR